MDVKGLEGFANWSLSPTDRPILGGNGVTDMTITLHVTPKVTTVGTTTHVVTGTRMFYVSAHDSNFAGTNIRRYWAGVVTVGDEVNGTPRDMPAVTSIPTNSELTYPFLSVVKGNQAKYRLDLDAWNEVMAEEEEHRSGGQGVAAVSGRDAIRQRIRDTECSRRTRHSP